MTKPETLAFRSWAENWLREKGYEVQDGLPWKEWKAPTPTIIYALDDHGLPVFGLLLHFARMPGLLKRLGIFLDSKPAPIGVYVFVPENAPFHIDIEFTTTTISHLVDPIEIVKSPPYAYNSKNYEDREWESSFSISLRARKPPE